MCTGVLKYTSGELVNTYKKCHSNFEVSHFVRRLCTCTQAIQTHIIAIHIRHMYSSLLQYISVVMTFGGYHANAICSHHGSTDNLFAAIYSAYIHVCTPNNISWLQASARHKYTFIIHMYVHISPVALATC